MLKRLPKQLKSGRVIVAIAGGGNVGLYTFPGLDDDYRVVTKAGQVWAGDGNGVPDPPEGRWHWLAADEDHGAVSEPQTTTSAPQTASTNPPATPLPITTNLCIDCEIDTRTLDHAHSMMHPARSGAVTICCPCVTKRGIACTLAARERLAQTARANQ